MLAAVLKLGGNKNEQASGYADSCAQAKHPHMGVIQLRNWPPEGNRWLLGIVDIAGDE